MQLVCQNKVHNKVKNSGFDISNRRYIGSKAKLVDWILSSVNIHKEQSICDLFAGSGVVAHKFINIPSINQIVLNDILLSNEIIYNAFFLGQSADWYLLNELKDLFNNIELNENYFSDNFSDKYFSHNDCLKIGSIREYIEILSLDKLHIDILLTSLIYSIDKIANTVGHYEAYIKKQIPEDKFVFELINPIKHNKQVSIYRQNANDLASEIKTDIVFIDPPYNSRQYSRFYHIYENLVAWEKPILTGSALKPSPSNMSEYCRTNAPKELNRLIKDLDCNLILLTYNNTYNSKSKSSQNKISFDEIVAILEQKGKLTIKEKEHHYFNAGKTDFKEHKEFLFIVEL